MNISKLKAEKIKEFEEKFANPDPFDSKNQFNPALAGRLYPEFIKFLSEALDSIQEEMVKELNELTVWTDGKDRSYIDHDEFREVIKGFYASGKEEKD